MSNNGGGDTANMNNNVNFKELMQMYADSLENKPTQTPDEILDEPNLSEFEGFSDSDSNQGDEEEPAQNNIEYLIDVIDDVESDDSDDDDDESDVDSDNSNDGDNDDNESNPQVQYLASLENTIIELQTLYKTMKQKTTLFDDDDRNWVRKDIDTLLNEYTQKKQLYLKSVMPLEKIIEERQKILSSVKCLQSRPELLNNFVSKQVEINQLLNDHKSQIFNTTNE